MNRLAFAVLASLIVLPVSAQSIVIGTQLVNARTGVANTAALTTVDLSHPAPVDGTVTTGSVQWAGAQTCVASYKVKFLRPASALSLTTYTLVGERGPFDSTFGPNVFPINPPLALKKGDLIGITALRPYAECGSPGLGSKTGAVAMTLLGDIGAGSFNGTYLRDRALSARATDTAQVLEGVITAAGSLQGNGAFFRTSVQIGGQPLSPKPVTGKLVFRRAGVAASPSDPSLPFEVSGGNVLSYDDVVAAMGQSGLGSIDVLTTSGAPPVVRARVYTDAGAAGTSGFTQEMITFEDALHQGDIGQLVVPSDLTNFRVNIGIRTFAKPLKLNVQYGFRTQTTVEYPANTFQQFPLTALTSIASPLPNERIFLWIVSGDAVIYQSTIDNRTQDSSTVFFRAD